MLTYYLRRQDETLAILTRVEPRITQVVEHVLGYHDSQVNRST